MKKWLLPPHPPRGCFTRKKNKTIPYNPQFVKYGDQIPLYNTLSVKYDDRNALYNTQSGIYIDQIALNNRRHFKLNSLR